MTDNIFDSAKASLESAKEKIKSVTENLLMMRKKKSSNNLKAADRKK